MAFLGNFSNETSFVSPKMFSGFSENENSVPHRFGSRFHGDVDVHAVHSHGPAGSEDGLRQRRSLATEGGVQPAEKVQQGRGHQVITS